MWVWVCGEGVEEPGAWRGAWAGKAFLWGRRVAAGREDWAPTPSPITTGAITCHLTAASSLNPHQTLFGLSRQRPVGAQEWGTCPWEVGQVWGHLHEHALDVLGRESRGGGSRNPKPEPESWGSACWRRQL